ncbi:hypothetical protein I79_005421 [Cricetulus griseus]|uniref:Uncharacterized protein n=1 Tax=Cricetulus griseus TaxID=10029 RepID=G3H551_CRIGR|nr:hypothetical protein I79_005421 [Cricetulus griseus]
MEDTQPLTSSWLTVAGTDYSRVNKVGFNLLPTTGTVTAGNGVKEFYGAVQQGDREEVL